MGAICLGELLRRRITMSFFIGFLIGAMVGAFLMVIVAYSRDE